MSFFFKDVYNHFLKKYFFVAILACISAEILHFFFLNEFLSEI